MTRDEPTTEETPVVTGVPVEPVTEHVPRNAGAWAGAVSTLGAVEAPPEALNLNVTGKRVTSPVQGFGKLWQKTYKVVMTGSDISPTDLISVWKSEFGSFWPKGSSFYGGSLTGIHPGDVALLNVALAGPMQLSTGILVLYADEESFTFMTPEGHMFAAWITFSAAEVGGRTVAQVQVLLRAGDPIYEVGMAFGGHRKEDNFWKATLEALAARVGATPTQVELSATCLDKRRQWSNARNIKHNAAIRSGIYTMTHPFRKRKARKEAARDSG
jgi:hypothetical protein